MANNLAFIKLLRTQKTAIGKLDLGVIYRIDRKNQLQVKVAKRLVERELAEPVSAEEAENAVPMTPEQKAEAKAAAKAKASKA